MHEEVNVALSNWALLALDENGNATNGILKSPLGVKVEIYKNWLYIADEAAWQDGGHYMKPTVLQVYRGDLVYKDVAIYARRDDSGPETIYAAVTARHHGKGTFNNCAALLIGCGTYAFDEDGRCVGVRPSQLEALREFAKEALDEEIFSKIDWSKALTVNKGDLYFHEQLGVDPQARPVGELAEPHIFEAVKKLETKH